MFSKEANMVEQGQFLAVLKTGQLDAALYKKWPFISIRRTDAFDSSCIQQLMGY